MNRSIAVAIVISALLPQFANAQTGIGAVRGQVIDSQSRAIVGCPRPRSLDENNRLVRSHSADRGLGRVHIRRHTSDDRACRRRG